MPPLVHFLTSSLSFQWHSCKYAFMTCPRRPVSLKFEASFEGGAEVDATLCRSHKNMDSERSFEVITGKSIADDGSSKCFALVNSYDEKPKRRVFEVLKSQGMQMNQQVIPIGFEAEHNKSLSSKAFSGSILLIFISFWYHLPFWWRGYGSRLAAVSESSSGTFTGLVSYHHAHHSDEPDGQRG